jgi:alpha-galactosidase
MKNFCLAALALVAPFFAADLALTPPMGWNSWNKFADKVDDKTIREIADAIVSSGMKDAGYVYVNIDDTWEGERDAQGNIQPNAKFPDMKALADYVHSEGLSSASTHRRVRRRARVSRAVTSMRRRTRRRGPRGASIT